MLEGRALGKGCPDYHIISSMISTLTNSSCRNRLISDCNNSLLHNHCTNSHLSFDFHGEYSEPVLLNCVLKHLKDDILCVSVAKLSCVPLSSLIMMIELM